MGRLGADVRERLVPIDVLHWNAPPVGAGDRTKDDFTELRAAVDGRVTSLACSTSSPT